MLFLSPPISIALLPLLLFVSPRERSDGRVPMMTEVQMQMQMQQNGDQTAEKDIKDTKDTNNTDDSNQKKKRLILIRHGRTHMNEYLSQEGSMWGDAMFTDVGLPDETYRDSPLSTKGIQQAQELYQQIDSSISGNGSDSTSGSTSSTSSTSRSGSDGTNRISNDVIDNIILDDIDLVVTSPLTRAFQTLEYGLLPHLLVQKDDHKSNTSSKSNGNVNYNRLDKSVLSGKTNFKAPIITTPLASERVYLVSDLGLPVKELMVKYPYADLSSEFDRFDEDEWWFTVKENENIKEEKISKVSSSQDDNDKERNNRSRGSTSSVDTNENKKVNGEQKNLYSFSSMYASDYVEWRPNTGGQTYACMGEPDEQFHNRMIGLYEWLSRRQESNIVLISHWGVLKWLTGNEFENCEMKIASFDCVKRYIEANHLNNIRS